MKFSVSVKDIVINVKLQNKRQHLGYSKPVAAGEKMIWFKTAEKLLEKDPKLAIFAQDRQFGVLF